MKILLLSLLLINTSLIENSKEEKEFEGRINFDVEFELKDDRVDKNGLSDFFGVKKEFLFKNGKYKWITKKGNLEFEIFNYSIDSLNTISKTSNIDTLYFHNFTHSSDSILSIDSLEIKSICGIECQGIRFNMTNEEKTKITRTLYFPINSMKYQQNYYTNQKELCNNFIYKYGGAIPLRLELEMDHIPFKLIYTASKLSHMKIDDKEFNINPKLPIIYN